MSNHGLAKAVSPAETTWRAALRDAGFAAPPPPNSVHASLFVQPGGDRAAAEQACRDLLEQEPRHRAALEAVAAFAQMRGDPGLAESTRLRLLQLEVDDMDLPEDEAAESLTFLAAAVGIDLAGKNQPPPRSPSSYIRRTFDAAAASFDELLVDQLAYRAPQLVREALEECLGEAGGELDVLDAGCGTGLCGPLLRPFAANLTGVDLSPAMLREAEKRNVYDKLIEADLVAWTAASRRAFDLIVAADVFIYLGDLTVPLAAFAEGLRPGGRAAFTVETSDVPGVHLQSVKRFAHHADHVARAAEDAGLKVRLQREGELRIEHGRPAPGMVFVVQRPS